MSDISDIRAMGGLGQSAGIAQGLAAGVDSFFNVRGKLQEEAIKKKLASAQTIEAYSKLANVMTPNQMYGLLQKQGLVPPMPSDNSGAGSSMAQPSDQGAPPAPEMSGGSASGSLAPSGKPQNGLLSPSFSSFAAGQNAIPSTQPQVQKSMGDMLPWEKEMAIKEMNAKFDQKQPAYQADLTNKAWEPLKDQAKGLQAQEERYTRGVRALKQGGSKSIPIIEDTMAQMMTEAGGKPIPLAEQFAEDPVLLNKYNQWKSSHTKDQMDPVLAEAFKKKFDLLAGATRDSYINAGKDAEKRASGWYPENPGWSHIGAIDSINGQMGPLHGGKAPQGLVTPGLMEGNNAQAATSKAPPIPPPGLKNKEEFKAWVLKNAP